MRAKQQHVCKEMNQYMINTNRKWILSLLYGFLSNFLGVIFKLDSYFLFKLKGYFLYFTPIVHSMPLLYVKRLIYLKNRQSLDLLVLPLKNDRP
jgi:hypothetical protein